MYTSPVYKHSPVWAQEVMLGVRGWARASLREGAAFHRELAEVERTQWLDEEGLRQLQLTRLRAVLTHAAAQVPYYRERFKAEGFDPRDLKSLDDMNRLPIIGKRDVFEAGPKLLNERHRGPRFQANTSGTTGMSMTMWRDMNSINRENAFVWRQLRWAGLNPGERRVWMRGDKVVPSSQTQAPFWRHNRGENMLMMSAYHLSEATGDGYLDAMERFDPVVFQAYPSAVLLMARHLISRGRKYRGRSLRGVVTSSETVTDEHRKLVDEAFGVRIFDWYGSCERMTAIGTCDHGRYHVMADYSYTELEPQPDGSCQAIGTAFDNRLMPLIRYRLGDAIVPAAPGTRCECGRAFPVIDHFEGRTDDYVIAPDGRHVYMMSNALDYLPNLIEGQVRQDSRDEITLLVVLAEGATLDERAAVKAVHSYMGSEVRVVVKRVDAVPRTANGKLRVVMRTIQ